MPSADLLARTTDTAAFQRTKRRMRFSMYSSPGNHGSASRGMVLMYGVLTVAGKLTCDSRALLEQLAEQEPGTGLAVRVDDGIEAVEPFERLAGVGVGELIDVTVEDHDQQSATATGG